ncbi:nitronate monooxygenase [Lentibacillus halodurans]|uniref:Probable nitronate monooxygenase n=1 Tax=Lentibacillus halodurans TaxID=237679 RepID=A0A1I0ZAH7_9BACI|nr:nitronate monooxygenase [Lentibacillus halodurans]SFB22654.1 nitronate monooxygenase [Lentibacillus halodurans]
MNIHTKITELLGIKYPIIQGGLQGLGTSELSAKVSEAGGLGLITAGSFDTKEEMIHDIEKARNITNKPLGVNIATGIRKPMDQFIDGAVEADVPIVFTSGRNPEPYIEQLKNNDTIVVHVAPSIRFLKKAESIGCDAVVVNGYECGGHPGKDDVTSLTIVQKASRELSIPVIAAGGFSTGKSLLAALSLGAEGVQMGTRFLLSKESKLHPQIKQKLLCMQENDTILVKKSIGKTARVWKNERSKELADKELKGAPLDDILPYISGESYKELIVYGRTNKGVLSLGQTIGMIEEAKSVKEIIEMIIDDFKKQLEQVNQLTERIKT